jgi:hypothetical protein
MPFKAVSWPMSVGIVPREVVLGQRQLGESRHFGQKGRNRSRDTIVSQFPEQNILNFRFFFFFFASQPRQHRQLRQLKGNRAVQATKRNASVICICICVFVIL